MVDGAADGDTEGVDVGRRDGAVVLGRADGN